METYDVPVRILCVDDERNVLRALERVFLDDDYEIVTADSGQDGMRIMQAEGATFQVVISDYRMPVMNGVEFLQGVYEQWPDTVRIVLSGYADAGAIVAAINDGHIYKFIPKPWNDEELRVTIQNCLERYFLQRKNKELLAELANANQQLESKVRQRTEELELRNKALEFSQTMLGNLPVGVVGIDENGLVAHCNTVSAVLMRQIFGDIFGVDLQHCKDSGFIALVERVRTEKTVDTTELIAGKMLRVLAKTVAFGDSEAVIMVFLEIV